VTSVLFIRQSDCNNEEKNRQSFKRRRPRLNASTAWRWRRPAHTIAPTGFMTAIFSAYRRLSGTGRGVLWMLASALAFTLMTTLVRYLGTDYGPALQTFYRQLAGTIVLLPVMLRNPKRTFSTTRPGILLFRSGCGVTAMILAFYAYQNMPLAEANALSFTRSLWMVPLAGVVLRETIGPRRLAATVIGFCGVLLMLHPSSVISLSLPAVAALASAFLIALSVTGMKIMTRDHSLLTIVAWSAALGLGLSIPPAVAQWHRPRLGDLALLAGMGILGLCNQACYVKAVSLGDATAVAPIDYTRLIFSILLGFLLFHETPSLVTLAGAAIVIASTLYITFREARLRSC
jgi:drug/metabolite transporter (DMT)-like permease